MASCATVLGKPPNECRRSLDVFGHLLGALAFDIWTLNLAPRHALFVRHGKQRIKTFFVDFSHCLCDANWRTFLDAGISTRPAVHWVGGSLRNWPSLAHW